MSEQDRRRLAHQQALAALMDELEPVVRTALRKVYRAAFTRMGLYSGATPSSFSVDDLATIPAAWEAELRTELLPKVDELYRVGWLAALDTYAPDDVKATTAAIADGTGTGIATGIVAGEEHAALVGLLTDAMDTRGVAYLRDSFTRLSGIGDTSLTAARTALTEGMAAGESIEELATRLGDVLDVSEVRAVTIARTEVVSAVNAGQVDAVKALGPAYAPGYKQWLATLGPRTRDAHAEADGQTVGLDETFTVDGEELEYPGDPAGSPGNTVNCRCTTIFVDEPSDTVDPGGRESGFPDTEVASAAGRTTTMRIRLPRSVWPASRPITAADLPADEPPVEGEEAPTSQLPEAVNDPAHGMVYPFSTLVTVEGRWTGDQRLVMEGAMRWDGLLPIPLTVPHDDDPNVTVGLVLEVERVAGPGDGEAMLLARGVLDAEHPMVNGDEGPGLARQIAQGFVRGVSMDLDDPVFGGIDPDTVPENNGVSPEEAEWVYNVVAEARLRALAVTSLPAFAECYITLGAVPSPSSLPDAPAGPTPVAPADMPERDEDPADEGEVIIVASSTAFRVVAAAPDPATCPPAEWFTDPGLTGPTPVTVTDDGRVYGHLALWNTCHTGLEECTLAPRSPSGYAAFRTGELVCADGSRVAVGALTVGTGHAAHSLRARPAAAHYDNTGTRAADVAAGEDRWGVWVAGSVSPTATPEQVYQLRAAPLSGDWRRVGTGLDLVAALAVNVPGFPVPRVALAASGQPLALTAAGIVPRDPTGGLAGASVADRIARSIGRDHDSRARALRARVHQEG